MNSQSSRRSLGRFSLALFACVGSVVPLALAQPQGKAKDAAPPTGTVVLAKEWAGVERMLVSPKDKALLEALHMVPARLRELPEELPDGANPPPEAIEACIGLLSSPSRVGVTYEPNKPTGGFAGFGVVLSFDQADEPSAARLNGQIKQLLALAPNVPEAQPSKAFAAMSEISTPLGRVRFGPRAHAPADGGGAGAWAYELHVGSVGDPDRAFGELSGVSSPGVKPFARARFDAAPLTPLLGMLQVFAAANPVAAQSIQRMVEGGFIGPESAKVNFVFGHDGEHAVAETAIRGLGDRAAKAGMSTQTLSDATLRAIPADAYWAWAGTGNMTYARQELESVFAAEPMAKQLLEQFQAQTGVDILEDVFGTLSGTNMMYYADSTGGPSLGGVVIGLGLNDAARLTTALTRLSELANGQLLNADPKGHVSLRWWGEGSGNGAGGNGAGPRCLSVRFPGLPVPIEPTFVIAGDWLIAGLTPQAALAAARQATGKGDDGVMSVPALASLFPAGKKFVTLSVTDTSKTMRHGYPIVSMLGSAVGNSVRSRGRVEAGKEPAREPGLIVPLYADLLKGACSQVTYSYWDGGDLVSRWVGDRSLLVNVSSTIGAAAPVLPLIPALAAVIAEEANKAKHQHDADDEADSDDEQPMEEHGKAPNFSIVPR